MATRMIGVAWYSAGGSYVCRMLFALCTSRRSLPCESWFPPQVRFPGLILAIVFRSQDDYDLREFKLVTAPPESTKVDGKQPDPAEERAMAQEYAVSSGLFF